MAPERRVVAHEPPSLAFHSDGIHLKTKRRLPAIANAQMRRHCTNMA